MLSLDEIAKMKALLSVEELIGLISLDRDKIAGLNNSLHNMKREVVGLNNRITKINGENASLKSELAIRDRDFIPLKKSVESLTADRSRMLRKLKRAGVKE